MKIQTTYDEQNHLRIHRVEGGLVFQELMLFLKDLYASDGFDSEQNSIWDFTRAGTAGLGAQDVEMLKNFVSKHWGIKGSAKSALIVSNDLDYGMSRMYEQLMGASSDSLIRVFLDQDAAMEWMLEKN